MPDGLGINQHANTISAWHNIINVLLLCDCLCIVPVIYMNKTSVPQIIQKEGSLSIFVVDFQLNQLHKLKLVLIYARVGTKKQSTKMLINQSQCAQIFDKSVYQRTIYIQ